MATRGGARLGRVSRVTGANIFVELFDVAEGYEFGPCLDTVGGLVVDDRVVVQSLARDVDEYVITGLLGGRDSVSPEELGVVLTQALATKANTSHTHAVDDVTSGTFGLARLPVAADGVSSSTALVRADDVRLGTNTRPDTGWVTPTLGNGWTQYGAPDVYPVGYRRLRGFTVLRGLGTKATTAADGPAFTLPAGFRPGSQGGHIFNQRTGNSGYRLDVLGNGAVLWSEGQPAGTYCSFSCIFPAEA